VRHLFGGINTKQFSLLWIKQYARLRNTSFKGLNLERISCHDRNISVSRRVCFKAPLQLSFWNIITLPLVRECYMHATKEQKAVTFWGTQKKKLRYFVTFVVGNIGGLLALLSVHFISASTHANTVAPQKLRRDSNDNWVLIKRHFLLRLMTWCRCGPLVPICDPDLFSVWINWR